MIRPENEGAAGKVVLVNGPVVKARMEAEIRMHEMVTVGERRLVGEVIKIEGDEATIQVYEETAGMRPGEPVRGTGAPLSVELGPGLLGRIFDGIQRPLPALEKLEGPFMRGGVEMQALERGKEWPFEPSVSEGEELQAGSVIGTVKETGTIIHKILVPPDLEGKVEWIAPAGSYTVDAHVCTLVDREGRRHELSLMHRWPVKKERPHRGKKPPTEPLVTGLRIIDTFFPVSKGGTASIPGGFGTGKTMTQHALAKWSNAQVIVYIGCGERGNEMTQVLKEFPELVDPYTGRSLMERTILVANTSNMPVSAREASIYTGITIAEYYRDMGYEVAIMADSTSRWAEALRELASRLGDMPAEGGFPAYLPARLAEFYERAGPVETLAGEHGSVTVIGAVSPQGGDFSEPVTQNTKRFTRCFWALDKELASIRHYPAISWLESYSEYVDELEAWWSSRYSSRWRQMRQKALDLLFEEEKLMKIAKLIGEDSLPENSRLILASARAIRIGFLQQNAFDETDRYTPPAKQVKMLATILAFHEKASKALQLGAHLEHILSLEGYGRLMRMKREVDNEDERQMDRYAESCLEELESLLAGLEKERSREEGHR